jgi:hypothetical protein
MLQDGAGYNPEEYQTRGFTIAGGAKLCPIF